jgi:hypothetical protein
LLRRNSRQVQPSSNFDHRTLSYDFSGSLSEKERKEKKEENPKRELIELMFTMIATCHECIPNAQG